MRKKTRLSVALVLYQNDPEMVRRAVISVTNTSVDFHFVIFDNSPSSDLSAAFSDLSIDYYYNSGENVGFGRGHNLALSKLNQSDYHLVLNPDVFFDQNVILELLDYLEKNEEIGLIQPKICFPDGEIQYLCKRYPTLFALFARRFVPKQLHFVLKNYLNWYEMRDTGYDKVVEAPYLSGCFMLFRKAYLDEIGYFDENIFMYLEDADITLRMAKKHKTVFYPKVQIFHHWAKGSYKSLKLTIVNIQSAFYFFNKHGWKLF